jgi:dihydroflavonol-4-reductase
LFRRVINFTDYKGIIFLTHFLKYAMRILITGANGLLGSNLARVMLKAGEKVTLFVRPTADLTSIADLPCEIIYGDILDADALSKAIENVDAVIHAASTTDMYPHPYSFYESVNVNGTKNILQIMHASPGKRLIYVSTANTFAPGTKQRPGNEMNAFNFFNYGSGYITSKYVAQQTVLEYVKKHHLDAVVVNPTFMIGPYDAKPSSGEIILFGLKSGLQWCPPGGKNFVSVVDVANGIRSALYRGKKGQCYLLAGENLSFREFFQRLNEIAHRKGRIVVLPKIIMYVAGVIGNVLNVLKFRKVQVTLTNMRLLCMDNYYTGAKAESELGLKISPIRDAIEEAVTWFTNHGYIKKK